MKDNTPDAGSTRRVHSILSTLMIVLGLVLLVYMVTVESEPGALPLLLLVVGIGWKLVMRYRSQTE